MQWAARSALFLSAAVLLGRDVLRPRDLLRIHPDGLEQFVTKPHVFLPWDAIESFSVIERGHRVKTLGITVRDPSALPQAGALDSGVSGLRDAADTLREDVAQHATLELATTSLLLRADELAELLSRQRAAALQVSATL
jgi:hypothetical protein